MEDPGEIGNGKLREIAGTGPEREEIIYYNVNFGDCLKLKCVVTSIRSLPSHTFLNHTLLVSWLSNLSYC